MTLNINKIIKMGRTLILSTIITITRAVRNDFKYNCHTQNMGNVDFEYNYYNHT